MSVPDGDNKLPFTTMAGYVAIPRLAGLALSLDGTRLVTSISSLNSDGTKWTSALWELDPAGEHKARRLTRSAPGESAPGFTPDGTLLFTSKRPDPRSSEDADDAKPALWAMPSGGGDARPIRTRPGGVSRFAVAKDSGDVVYVSEVASGAGSAEEDGAARKAREDAGVSAVLHEEFPVRYWDHDLTGARPRLFHAGPLPEDPEANLPEGTDLTGDRADYGPAPVHFGGDATISPDGRFVAVSRELPDEHLRVRTAVELVEIATGARTQLAGGPGYNYRAPAFSPSGSGLACVRDTQPTYDAPPDQTIWLVDLDTGHGRDLTPELDLWPDTPAWSADGSAVLFTADRQGHHPAFRVDLTTGTITQLTASGSYSDLTVAEDGSAIYALRAAIDAPPRPVRLDPAASGQEPPRLPAPGELRVPGTLTELEATAEDGTPVRGWLVLPEGASAVSPAPLLLFIHGGPMMSSNSWSWRWNPWLLAARGYAMLMPDPALSSGYGQHMIRRGWGRWGGEPYTDLMAITDAAEARPEIDRARTAALGASFGGYMANWVATQTDRFRCIVTHASLWHLEHMYGVSDEPDYWRLEFGDPRTQPERYQDNSPHLFTDKITTPMLIIHGDKDYRVPLSNAQRLFYDLKRAGVPARFLYFPDENHWILTPGNAKIQYETIFAFLAEHLDDQPWQRPALL